MDSDIAPPVPTPPPPLPLPLPPSEQLVPLIYNALQDPLVRSNLAAYLESHPGERIVPVHQRAVTTSFLQRFISPKLAAMSPGQLVHGVHTNGPPDDWKHFDIHIDPTCIRGLTTNSTGLSLVETMLLLAKVTGNTIFSHDQTTGEPYFGNVDIFVSYGWHGTSLGDLEEAILFFSAQEESENIQSSKNTKSSKKTKLPQSSKNTKSSKKTKLPQNIKSSKNTKSTFFWIDVFAIAQNRDTPEKAAANSADVGAFSTVVRKSVGTALYWNPLFQPAVLARVWCLYEILETHKAGNPIQLLLTPSDRKQLLQSIVNDRGKSLLFQVEGQSSVNAASTYERDWCRIHTSIEVILNPKSMGAFVRAPDTITHYNESTGEKELQEFSNGGNASEGWLGQGDWVNLGKTQGKLHGQNIPPWLDYVFIEEEGYGEMNETADSTAGHGVLDRIVRDSIYTMFRTILQQQQEATMMLEPLKGTLMETQPQNDANEDIDEDTDDSSIGYLFQPAATCKWMVEYASSEEVQMFNCTVSAFTFGGEENIFPEVFIDEVVERNVVGAGNVPVVITSMCTVGDGQVAVGDDKGQVRLWDAKADTPGTSPIYLEPLFLGEEDDGESMWEFILVALCEVDNVLVGLAAGGLLTLWSLEEDRMSVGRILGQVSHERFNGCLCSVVDGLFLVGLHSEEEEEEEEEDDGEKAEVAEEKTSVEVEDDDSGFELFGCLALWRLTPAEDSPLTLIRQFIDMVDVPGGGFELSDSKHCIDNVNIIVPIGNNNFAVAGGTPYSSSIGIVDVSEERQHGAVGQDRKETKDEATEHLSIGSFTEVYPAPITLPVASSISTMSASENFLVVGYSSLVVVYQIDRTGTTVPGSLLSPLHILGQKGVYTMVLNERKKIVDSNQEKVDAYANNSELVVYSGSSGGLMTWRVPF